MARTNEKKNEDDEDCLVETTVIGAPTKRNNEEKGTIGSLTGLSYARLLFPKPKLGPLYLSAALLWETAQFSRTAAVSISALWKRGVEFPLAVN